MDARTITVLGASARYACLSLRRGGLACAAIDLFADLETQLAGTAVRVDGYPRPLFEELQRRSDRNAWMYTGGLENAAALVDAAADGLLGSSAGALRQLRDPQTLTRLLAGSPIQQPATRATAPPDPRGWLVKSARSCGGLGVAQADEPKTVSTAHRYFQKFIEGAVLGATFVASRGRCVLLGAAEALLSRRETWTGARPFAYCGSVGPVALPERECAAIAALGHRLAQVEGLTGVFGLDLVRAANREGGNQLFLLDVNPRLPTSAELLERASGQSIARIHVDACRDSVVPSGQRLESTASTLHGKSIVYARSRVHSTKALRDAAAVRWEQVHSHWLADTPAADSTIEAGQPIATVFADAENLTEVIRQLQARAEQVRRLCQRR